MTGSWDKDTIGITFVMVLSSRAAAANASAILSDALSALSGDDPWRHRATLEAVLAGAGGDETVTSALQESRARSRRKAANDALEAAVSAEVAAATPLNVLTVADVAAAAEAVERAAYEAACTRQWRPSIATPMNSALAALGTGRMAISKIHFSQ